MFAAWPAAVKATLTMLCPWALLPSKLSSWYISPDDVICINGWEGEYVTCIGLAGSDV